MRIAPVVAIAAGALLIGLGAPRLFAGAVAGPFDETVRALGRGETAAADTLRLALGSRLHATRAVGEGGYYADVAALRFADYRANPEDRALLDAAIDAHRAALDRAPSQPFVWSRLALALTVRDGYSPAAGQALAMSLDTAPVEPRLLMPRIELALAVWPEMPDALRDAFAGQIQRAMRWSPDALVAATRRYHRLREVREALAADPELRARFSLMYGR